MATSVQPLRADSPLLLELFRKGGSIIAARFDFWQAGSPALLAGSRLLQAVKLAHEVQQLALPPGEYTCVLTVRVEESLNGTFGFQVKMEGVDLGSATGDVNTSPNPNDSRVMRKQFPVVVTLGA